MIGGGFIDIMIIIVQFEINCKSDFSGSLSAVRAGIGIVFDFRRGDPCGIRRLHADFEIGFGKFRKILFVVRLPRAACGFIFVFHTV